MNKITEIIPDDFPTWAQDAFDTGHFFKVSVEKVTELQDLVIWMTGCGYDFTQHKFFCEQRDKLLKN